MTNDETADEQHRSGPRAGAEREIAIAAPASLPEFGRREPGIDYLLRPGGYAVIVRGGELAVVETPSGLFLPGGGCEAGEDAAAAAVREAFEECGLRIELGLPLGVADELVHSRSEARHWRKRCSFFLARATAQEGACEVDHELRWLPRADALERLRDASQRWAVARAPARWQAA
jgi:8-oxo-dGTP pyrophosphatase MutT (NUDIX family)